MTGKVYLVPYEVADGVPQMQLLRAARLGRLHAEEWRVRRDGSRYWAETMLTSSSSCGACTCML